MDWDVVPFVDLKLVQEETCPEEWDEVFYNVW
jgi:hypothetical protein